MAVDAPFRLLVGMQLIHYFIHSGQCYLALPLFVTLEEFFESIKWLVQTAFLLSFRTLFPISNRSYLIWVKSRNHVHIVFVHFFPQIWETLVKGSRQLAVWFFWLLGDPCTSCKLPLPHTWEGNPLSLCLHSSTPIIYRKESKAKRKTRSQRFANTSCVRNYSLPVFEFWHNQIESSSLLVALF